MDQQRTFIKNTASLIRPRISRLRRMRVYPSVRNVTLITYYKSKSDDTFLGKALLVSLSTLQCNTVELGHVGVVHREEEIPP